MKRPVNRLPTLFAFSVSHDAEEYRFWPHAGSNVQPFPLFSAVQMEHIKKKHLEEAAGLLAQMKLESA
jgi:hypothetical protein